jgi:hypothetical protein
MAPHSSAFRPGKGLPDKIQWICNGKWAEFTMQDIEIARKNARAQEQWKAMEKTIGKQ